MFYKSLDELPLKLFLKILKTGDYTLLSTENKEAFDTEKVWKTLEKDFNELDPENNIDKLLGTLIKFTKYTAQYNAIKITVQALRFERDLDLENLIRSQGFKLKEQSYTTDLDKVEVEVEAIQLLINEQAAKLPKKEKDSKDKAQNIDEVILGYSSVVGLNFDTNKITVTQFYALKKLFDQKIQQIKKQNENNKKGNKRRT